MSARLIPLCLAWAAAFVTPAHAASADAPESFAVHIPVTVASSSSLQRLNLPARVLVAIQRSDMADVRVFNARGQAVPIARSPIVRTLRRQDVALAVMPILGTVDALTVTGATLRIDESRNARVVQVNGTLQPPGRSTLIGILLDTRRITDPISALSLDLQVPAGQPVTFTIESSSDLKQWQTLADKVIYRTGSQTAITQVPFARQLLQGRYLRVTWQAASPLLSPVVIRSARAVTQRDRDSVPSARVVLLVPPMSNAHAMEFTVPFSAPIAAIEISAVGGDTIVPVSIFGRNQREEPWTPIASGAVSRVTRDGRTLTNPAFDLTDSRYRTLRIEADPRTPGFETAPTIVARLKPAQILFLATGPRPFTLAAGKADARSVYLRTNDLMRAADQSESRPPLASTQAQADPIVTTIAADQGTSWRRIGLWAVLLAGTALLGLMVWTLMRQKPAD